MLKMNELVKLSGVAKSTILYYIKEGLLPQPQKPKANLHLYDENLVEQINFIQYLQKNFNCSISELKAIFAHDNFNKNNPYEALLNVLTIAMGSDFTHIFTKEELCTEFKLSQKDLEEYVNKGFLYTRDGVFTKSERDMLDIITSCETQDLELIKEYIKISKHLANLEVKLGLKHLLDGKKDLKHIFDLMLILKPYIFNMQTLKIYLEEKK